MTWQQAASFGLIVLMMAAFVWGRFRYDLVAMVTLLSAVLIGIVPADKAFSGFSDDIIAIIASALVVSAAVARSSDTGEAGSSARILRSATMLRG